MSIFHPKRCVVFNGLRQTSWNDHKVEIIMLYMVRFLEKKSMDESLAFKTNMLNWIRHIIRNVQKKPANMSSHLVSDFNPLNKKNNLGIFPHLPQLKVEIVQNIFLETTSSVNTSTCLQTSYPLLWKPQKSTSTGESNNLRSTSNSA